MHSKESVQEMFHSKFPLIKKLGISIEKLTMEEVETRLPENSFNNNHLNTVYAGIQFTMLEVTGGIIFAVAFDISRYFMVVKKTTIEYHRPAQGPLVAYCRFPTADRELLLREIETVGNASCILSIDLKDDSRQVVASARATYFVRLQQKH